MNTIQINTYKLDDHISISLKREYIDKKHYHYIEIQQTFYNDGMIYKTITIDLKYNEFVQIKALAKEKIKELEWNSI